MRTEFQVGSTVLARGIRFIVVAADPVVQDSGRTVHRLRLRALEEPFRNEEVCVLHPLEPVQPDGVPELDIARPGRLARFQLLMDAIRLGLAPGDDRLVSSVRSRIQFEPYQVEYTKSNIRNSLRANATPAQGRWPEVTIFLCDK